MSSPVPVDPDRWSRGRYLAAFAMIFAFQVVLVFALSRYSSTPPRTASAASTLKWIEPPPGEMLPLENPLLLVRPHWKSPSVVWKSPPALESGGNRSEPLWLDLNAEQLGSDFARFVKTNPPPAFQTMVMPEVSMVFPDLPPVVPLATSSDLRIEGNLAHRRLLSRPQLPAWRHTELLTNTVVQVLVDAHGNVISPRLLAKSRLDLADQYALHFARSNRFEPIGVTGPARLKTAPEPTTGTLVFEWQTLPPTNGAASPP